MARPGRLFALLMVIMLTIAGCGAGGQGGAANQSPQTQTGAGGQQQQQPADTQNNAAADNGRNGGAEQVRTIEHAMGKTDITGTPERVATLFQGATDAALQLGVKPVGAVESWIEQPWYNYIRDRMDGVTNLGSENQPDLEQLVALKPDLIIASKTRHENIAEQLSAIAPTVMTEEVHIWKDSLNLAAQALNKQEEADAFMAEWDAKVADFKAQMGDKLADTEVAIVDFRADHVRIVYTGFSALVLEELGILRPANQHGESWGIKLTSKESIPEMNADVIFDQTSLSRDDGRLDMRKEWTEHPLWQNLRAVQNNKVYEVDPAIWNNGSGPMAAKLMVDDVFEYLELQ